MRTHIHTCRSDRRTATVAPRAPGRCRGAGGRQRWRRAPPAGAAASRRLRVCASMALGCGCVYINMNMTRACAQILRRRGSRRTATVAHRAPGRCRGVCAAASVAAERCTGTAVGRQRWRLAPPAGAAAGEQLQVYRQRERCGAECRRECQQSDVRSGVPADGQAVRANSGECAGRERYGADCRRRGMPAYGYPDRDDQIVDIY